LMKVTTLIYSVLISAVCVPWNVASAQSTVSTTEQQASSQVAPPAKLKRSVNPESIKRAKLTRLRKDVALTDDQATKVKPIIDAYVNDMQAIKTDASLASRTKRQKFSEVRQKYDRDLDGVLNPEQQQKLASLRDERRARLRAARTGKASAALEPSASTAAPAIVQ
jgi:Spy/CpxP family protein refolding chaperone